MNAKATGCSLASPATDDLAANGVAAIEFLLHAALIKQKITPNGPGIREMSVKCFAVPSSVSPHHNEGLPNAIENQSRALHD